MARKSTTITITEGRDANKTFKITEWPATRIEDWAMRAAFGLGKAGVEIPAQVIELGAAGIAYFVGTQVLKMPSRLGVRLSRELMECVKRAEDAADRSLVENDTEDFQTLFRLKKEVLKLTFGFFPVASHSNSVPSVSGAKSSKP